MADIEGKQKQVVTQVDRLQQGINLLGDKITNLEATIEPVLGLTVSKPGEAQKPEPKCKLAMNLEMIADQAQRYTYRLQELIDRVEV